MSATTTHVQSAMKFHFCTDCHTLIRPGESYERLFVIDWDETVDQSTCAGCLGEWEVEKRRLEARQHERDLDAVEQMIAAEREGGRGLPLRGIPSALGLKTVDPSFSPDEWAKDYMTHLIDKNLVYRTDSGRYSPTHEARNEVEVSS